MSKKIDNIVRHAEVSEKAIEKYLCRRMGELGLPCLKYTNANMTGYPDRLIVLPASVCLWVELKSKGRKPSRTQEIRMEELRKMGHVVWVIDNKPLVDELAEELKKWLRENDDYMRGYETIKVHTKN